MKVALFQSDIDPEVFAFTDDMSGRKLPLEFAPWHKLGSAVQTGPGNPEAGKSSTEHVAVAITRHGFYVARSPSSVAIAAQFRNSVMR